LKNLAFKLFGGENPESVLAKRIKIFVLICIMFVVLNKLTLSRIGLLPNFELILPTLVVIGSFSLYSGRNRFWRGLTRYFGIVALIGIFIVDLYFWGFHLIYAFTWSGFAICWALGLFKKLSMFGRYQSLLYHTMLRVAVAILFFDIFTALGWWMVTSSALTLSTLLAVLLAQVPFTLYHFSSLIFVPPLVGLAKGLAKIPVKVPVAVSVRTKVMRREMV
jgi:hypothetical protein